MKTVARLIVRGGYALPPEGQPSFVRLRNLTLAHEFGDGSVSADYPCAFIGRDGTDAVAVVPWRRDGDRITVFLVRALRPPVALRANRPHPTPLLWEVPAGILEPGDGTGDEAVRRRAVAELSEEAGFRAAPSAIEMLGAPFYPSPGINQEAIYLCAVEVHGEPGVPHGDGSPYEDLLVVEPFELRAAVTACTVGAIVDAKTEIALRRLAARLLPGGGAP